MISKIVKEFAKRMQFKLDKNKHKKDPALNPDNTSRKWDNCSHEWLLYRLREEVLELEKALFLDCDYLNAANECADIANFAMMIFDNINKKLENE